MLGDTAVGKTSIAKRFAENTFSPTYLQTNGVNIMKKTVLLESDEVVVMVWDIEGSLRNKAVSQQYLKDADGAIIVADISRIDTRQTLDFYIQTAKEHHIPYIIAQNKIDLIGDVSVESEISDGDCIDTLATSAKAGTNIEHLFESIVKSLLVT